VLKTIGRQVLGKICSLILDLLNFRLLLDIPIEMSYNGQLDIKSGYRGAIQAGDINLMLKGEKTDTCDMYCREASRWVKHGIGSLWKFSSQFLQFPSVFRSKVIQ
jgi:hypothetical protein